MGRTTPVEIYRPYLGETLWFLFFVYRAFLGRLNKAAGAADATRGGMGGSRALAGVFCGSQGGPCDPTSTKDAGGTPASQLRPEYRKRVPANRAGLRPTLPSTAR